MTRFPEPTGIAELRLPHDASFKLFVRHPTFIRHLLRAFPVSSVKEEDIVELRGVPSSFVGADLEQRRVDSVWVLEMRDGELVYLLVECQSHVDHTMHWRMFHATGILGLSLSRNPPRGRGYTAMRSPRIRGLVVYSGAQEWNVPLDTAEAVGISDSGDQSGEPSCCYQLLDLRRVELPAEEGNVAVLLQRLQVCDSPDGLHTAAGPLRELAGREGDSRLATAFASWVSGVLLPAMGVEGAIQTDRLEEVLDMLAKERMNWAERMREEGRLDGQRELLVGIAGARFGPSMTQTLATLLESVSDPQRLKQVGEWLTAGMSGDALLARLGHR